jgi:hypothetical protein
MKRKTRVVNQSEWNQQELVRERQLFIQLTEKFHYTNTNTTIQSKYKYYIILYYKCQHWVKAQNKVGTQETMSVGSFEVEQYRKVGYQMLQWSQGKSRNQHINSQSSCRSKFGIRKHLDNKQCANQLRRKDVTAQTRQKSSTKDNTI